MPRILLTSGPDDWQKMLADPEKYWRLGYSARPLASSVLLGSFGSHHCAHHCAAG